MKIFQDFKVKWSGWSIVLATRLLANTAISDGSVRLTLLSGVSYPIISDEKLIKLAVSDLDIFRAGEVDLETIDKAFRRRFTSRHLEFKFGNSLSSRIVRRISREVCTLLPELNPEVEIFPLKLTLGSQWWSVSIETYQGGMSKLSNSMESYFKKIECSDESFFGTLFTAVSQNHKNSGTTYVIWGNNGRPIYLDEIDKLDSKDFIFARKFSSQSFKNSDY